MDVRNQHEIQRYANKYAEKNIAKKVSTELETTYAVSFIDKSTIKRC